ncbi:serine/threonine-protein kinase [Tahibacter sp.]|uniref:serine/threonine-protein kinase n=1 Tax=Tahibacter sp. TaxID=2056211 RepID=UPI0028C40ACC|nr:serine/threonine-protein kinase [Tahibacter sp.]
MQERYTYDSLADLFTDLIELPKPVRHQRLEELALHPQDHRLLVNMLRADANTEPGFLDEPVVRHAQALKSDQDLDTEPEGLIGQQFGAFRLRQLVGQGGMATVFLAERVGADFAQCVAVKLLRRGLFSAVEQRLFRRERMLLAQLDHPNIARLIDGGVTAAGIPYLVLEFVDGRCLDEYVVEERLDLRARLALFITSCRAVEAAHRALIVHRDIKPSNILVTRDGVPKLLDFGIAKLLLDGVPGDSPHTLTAALTPGYAAPEQIAGSPVTTATDVYALGVVLHELLTGQRPRSPDTVPASAAISDRAATSPGALPLPPPLLRRALRGDLDNIIARALCAEPERRYPSAAALIEDLESYLDGRPVHAHPRSRWYLARKFVRRHRTVAVTTLAFSLAVFGALGVAVWQGRAAQAEAKRANVVRDFLLDLLDTAKAELPPDEQPTPAVLATRAARRLATNATLPALTRAELLQTLGRVSATAAAYDQAASLFEQAIEIRSDQLGPEHADVLSVRVELASVRNDQGRTADARDMLQRALPALRRDDSKDLVPALALMGSVELTAGNSDAAIAYERESAAAAARLLDPASIDAHLSRLGLGNLMIAADRWREGVDALVPELAAWRSAGLPTSHAKYSASISNLAVAYHSLGEYDKALPLFEQSLAARRKSLPVDHPALGNSIASLGMLLAGMMRFDQAEMHLQESLRISRAAYGDTHLEVALHLSQLASVELRRHHDEAASRYAREAVDICTRARWTAHSNCSYATVMLGSALRHADPAQSLRYLDIGLQQYRDQNQAPHALIATALSKRATTLLTLKRFEEARRDIESALAMFAAANAAHSLEGLIAVETRALVLHHLGNASEALSEIDRALPVWRERFAARKDRLLSMLETRVKILLALGDRASARASAHEALGLGLDDSVVRPETTALLKAAAR